MRLRDGAKDAIMFEMKKIKEIERFLVEQGIRNDDVKYYALAIYNKCQDLDVIIEGDDL